MRPVFRPAKPIEKPNRLAVGAMKEQVLKDMAIVNAGLLADRTLNHKEAEAMASIETFVAIALRVMAKVSETKIRDAMLLVEIQARMDGRKVFE